LAAIHGPWNDLAAEFPDCIDDYTVSVLVKNSHSNMTKEMLRNWASDSDADGNEKPRIFPGLNSNETKKIIDKAVDAFGVRYYIFALIIDNQRPYLDEFYSVIEQIPCWFSQDAREGYDGGGSIVNHDRTDKTLRSYFGETGYASIMLYVMHHYSAMHEIGQGLKVEDSKYLKRFSKDLWFFVAKTLFARWKVVPIEPTWATETRRLDQTPGSVKVKCCF